jgi:hypothetical protein
MEKKRQNRLIIIKKIFDKKYYEGILFGLSICCEMVFNRNINIDTINSYKDHYTNLLNKIKNEITEDK